MPHDDPGMFISFLSCPFYSHFLGVKKILEITGEVLLVPQMNTLLSLPPLLHQFTNTNHRDTDMPGRRP